MTTFSITYNSLQLQAVEKQLDAFLQSNRNVVSWAKPFDGLYLVRSNLDRIALYVNLKSFFPDSIPFFVASVTAAECVGTLPQNVWDWLNSVDYSALLS